MIFWRGVLLVPHALKINQVANGATEVSALREVIYIW